jgi:hypothetical protein
MEIDFHHGVTYVAARLAGFEHKEAAIIAHSSQYVDDATNSGTICFDNNALYTRISPAHKTLDYRNLKKLDNHHVWIPFHLLPGNGGKKAGENPSGSFIEKIICRANSPVAQDMVRLCIEEKDSLYGLHRLGVTMHIYADTWSHQGFAGVIHPVNQVEVIEDGTKSKSNWDRIKDRAENIVAFFIGDIMPLAHVTALTNPDLPFKKWSYKRGNEVVVRDNPPDYIEAADEMCKVMQRFRIGDADAEVSGIQDPDKATIKNMVETYTDESGVDRHKKWLKAIKDGKFSFPGVDLKYVAKGDGSWKHQAIGTTKEIDEINERYKYYPDFLRSDWKLFHDACLAHRFAMIHDVLPRYGICAA